ncbi:MAG TPA: TIGR00366 family protein [Steroidobacteraceae bacterium]|nr:TIGR00366 family protein [Steroidobacteraceae bacterium]
MLDRFALQCCNWSQRWIPDAYVFAALAVLVVAIAALAIGVPLTHTADAFGGGFWSLIPFTMQMSFIVIGGYVVASAPVCARAIDKLASWPSSSRGAVALVAATSMLASLLHWGLSMVFGALLVRALNRRGELQLNYFAAAAAAYLGMGSIWALGLSSSAAQLQANPASMPPQLLAITGVLPFEKTIFLWQSLLLTAVLFVVTLAIAWFTASPATDRSEIEVEPVAVSPIEGSKPADWLERQPLFNIALALLGGIWLFREFAAKGFAGAIANLNTYNFLFLTLGLLLCWRPRVFIDAVGRAVPAVAGVLIQFPLYGGIAAILTSATNAQGESIAQHLAHFFTSAATEQSFPIVVGIYSAVLGFFVPSGGGKWVIEAPYVMQAANELHVNLGWAVQTYNAAEALPNLINPFWMLPLLGILRLRARDVIGYTMVQFIVHAPVVLFLLWALGLTLSYEPPHM